MNELCLKCLSSDNGKCDLHGGTKNDGIKVRRGTVGIDQQGKARIKIYGRVPLTWYYLGRILLRADGQPMKKIMLAFFTKQYNDRQQVYWKPLV